MSNPSISTGQESSSLSGNSSTPATSTSSPYHTGYQQALADFALADLLHRLQTYSDRHFDAAWVALKPQEVETIAALLIQSLTATLNGNLLSNYLTAIRHSKLDTSPALTSLELPPPSTDFPTHFPDVEMPRFLYGDRLCWLSNGEVSDRGIVIGRFYNFAPHRCRWAWCYLLWLDSDSPSSAWVSADIAWEDDLQPLDAENLNTEDSP
ncbi:MAG: hypothetical protein Kow00121_20790 [Elainellaceae cyanobacterium]